MNNMGIKLCSLTVALVLRTRNRLLVFKAEENFLQNTVFQTLPCLANHQK